MNRQRRMEAIARRRAFIDSQLQMLANSHEARVPNIIRHRTGRLHTRSDVIVPSSSLFQQSNVLPLSNIEATSAEERTTNIKQETSDLVPVEISESLASIIASNNGDILKSFQTIQAEDGTVMVVLEDDGDCVLPVVDGLKQEASKNQTLHDPLQVTDILSSNSHSQTDSVELLPSDSQSQTDSVELLPSDSHIQTDLVEVEAETNNAKHGEEETYVLLQSENGSEVLLPYSAFCAMQHQQQASSEELIDYVAAESGAIEDQMSRNTGAKVVSVPIPFKKITNSVTPSQKRKIVPSMPSPHVFNSKRLNLNNTSYQVPQAKFPKNESVEKRKKSVQVHNPASKTFVQVNQRDIKPPISNNREEKPRPFRFELPELETEDQFNYPSDHGFLTVPVPIKIDGLQSETKLNNPVEGKEITSFQAKIKHADKNPLTCEKCPATFTSVLHLLNHVKQLHSNDQVADKTAPAFVSTISKDGSTVIASIQLNEESYQVKTETLSSHCSVPHQSITCMIQNDEESQKQMILIPPQQDTEDTGNTIYFHILDDGEVEQSTLKDSCDKEVGDETNHQSDIASISMPILEVVANSHNQTEVSQHMVGFNRNSVSVSTPDIADHSSNFQGRRTLNKATAKAGMSNGSSTENGGIKDDEIWIEEDGEPINFVPENIVSSDSVSKNNAVVSYDGDLISVQSARIRARNDRVKAMNHNSNQEEELSISFKNIFQQVAQNEFTLF